MPFFVTTTPLAVEPGSMPRPLVQKKTWRNSLPIDMLLSAVSVLVVAQSSSEIPEGLMSNPVLSFSVFTVDIIDVMVLLVFYTMYYSGFFLLLQRNKLPRSSRWLNLFQVAVFALKKGPAVPSKCQIKPVN